MLWSLIFFSSLSLGNCGFWSHDRWQNSQATIKCDTHHSPISPNTKHGMGCPSSNLFDMWIFGSRYVGTWILWHFNAFFSSRQAWRNTHFFARSWKLDVDDLYTIHDDKQHYVEIPTILCIYLVRGVVMSYPLSCYDHWFEILLVYRHDKRHKDADLHLSDRIPALNMPDIQRPGTLNPRPMPCAVTVIQRLSLASCSGGEWIKMTRWLLTINGTVLIEKKKRQFEYLNVAEDYFKHFARIAKYIVFFCFLLDSLNWINNMCCSRHYNHHMSHSLPLPSSQKQTVLNRNQTGRKERCGRNVVHNNVWGVTVTVVK